MPVLKIKTENGWEELGGTSPADGGNADTLDGKHADEFALVADMSVYLGDYATIYQLNNKSDKEHSHHDIYYTKSEIDSLALIAVEDIDAICGATIYLADEVEV